MPQELSNIILCDTHCHLLSLEHKPIEDIISDSIKNNVSIMLCIGLQSVERSAQEAFEFVCNYDFIWAALGVHPHDAGEYLDIDFLEPLISKEKVVGIGETGLDFFRDWSPFENQKMLFRNTIALAKNLRKPLIIHSRDALDETVEIIRQTKAKEVGGVFHCYSGEAELAKELADLNFLVSFPGTLTFKNAHRLRETAKQIPIEQIMLETDCPYMAPEPDRGKPSEPKHVLNIALKLADVKQMTLEEVAKATTANAKRLFRIRHPDS